MLLKENRVKIALVVMLICTILAGCGANNSQVSREEALSETSEISAAESEQDYSRVIALSKSNAELWILAGGSLIATSDDAMDIEGLNDDAVSLGDMDHVSLEAVTALEPDLLILFSSEPAQKALGEAAEGIGLKVYYDAGVKRSQLTLVTC